MPMSDLISFCGGSSKTSEIKYMIAAYNDMEKYYRPLCNDDTMFNIKKFQGFVELQKKSIIDAIISHGYTKTDFSRWILEDRIVNLQDVRRIPDILNSRKATEKFLKENITEAIKILAVEEITPDKLKDVPYELLAKELSKRILAFSILELRHLRDDAEYSYKLNGLRDVCENIQNLILSEIDGD
jgi:hypothetical protein